MNRLITMLSAGVAALMLSGSAFAADPDVVTPAQIEAAKTPADHEAIAKAYDAEASKLDAMAQEHEAMAKAYAQMQTGHKGGSWSAMAGHCESLVKQYKASAQQNRDLAKEHREMAKAAGH